MILPITVTTEDKDLSKFLELGVRECNWQMFSSDLDDPIGALNHILSLGVTPISLHTPFRNRSTPLEIEYVEHDDLLKASLLACNSIGERLNSRIPTVCHTDLPLSNPWWAEAIRHSVQEALKGCPNVDLLIENGPVYPDFCRPTVDVFKNVVGVANTLGLGTCFDVCHAEMVIKLATQAYEAGIIKETPCALIDALKEFSETCRLVHLANARNFGLFKDHGRGFTESADIQNKLTALKNYVPNAKVVLEISEDDYQERQDAYNTLLLMKDIHAI